MGELGAIGLTEAEETLYDLLVDRPPGTLEVIAAVCHDPLLRAALDGLESKGLVQRSGEPARYVAVAPDVALEALLLDQEQRLSRARDYVADLIAARRDNEPGDVVEVVSGHRAVRQRLAQVQRGAREQVRCLDKPPYLDRFGTAAADLRLLADGLRSRTIYERTSVDQPDALRGIEELMRAGQRSRVLPELPMKLYLIDNRFAVVPLDRRTPVVDGAIFIRPSPLLDTFDILFESLWQRALPLGAAPAEPGDDDRLIALLLSGLTDRAIARQLDVGYRTVQRRVAALLADLGVHTRFQAGVQVALRRPRW